MDSYQEEEYSTSNARTSRIYQKYQAKIIGSEGVGFATLNWHSSPNEGKPRNQHPAGCSQHFDTNFVQSISAALWLQIRSDAML